MATAITTRIILSILSVAIHPNILIQGQKVPCLFIFGDSEFDNGNNNGLNTEAKVNHAPYGIDYPGGVPTGRFTNALNIPDILADLLGFRNSIPPFVSRGADIRKGVNYASGGAGILNASGTQLGARFTMDDQLENHLSTVGRIAANYLSKCLYAVNIGSNDYINNYYLPQSASRASQTPDQFADLLINTFSQQLRKLYNSGSRKVAVFGVGLIGCIPQELSLYPINRSGCVDEINNAVGLFNVKLVSLIDQLNANLTNARFTYINITNIFRGGASLNGIKNATSPCCQVQKTIGQCVPNGAVCRNRNEYAFFDNFHPTQTVNNATASRSYTALSPLDAHPVDIGTLVRN